MAEKYGFLKIGEANAAIEKLTKERDELKARAEAAEANADEVAKQAEQARKDSEGDQSIQKLLDDERAAHSITKQKLEKAEADLKTAKDEVAALPAKIESEGSKRAQQIAASQGIPPIPATPATTPATPSNDISKLTGIEKVKAAFRAQLKPAATL